MKPLYCNLNQAASFICILFFIDCPVGLAANAADIPKTDAAVVIEAKKKPSQPWSPKETCTIAQLQGYAPKPDPAGDRFGGMTDTRFPATGFFYTTKFNGRWWLVDPEGRLCIHKAICAVSPGASKRFTQALTEKFGTERAWAEATTANLKNLGFNGTGAWSTNALLRSTTNPPVYVEIWNFMASYAMSRGAAVMGAGNHKYKEELLPVFDQEFAAYADEYARRLADTKNDPYLLGHFSDNELPLRPKALDLCLALPTGASNHQAALEWLKKRKGKSEITPEDVTAVDREAFFAYYLERYYSIVSAAIKKYDPNHLYLGSRLIGVTGNETAMRTYAKYADVMSINWYGAWTLPRATIEQWAAWTDKPFIISEWYAKGQDAPGLSNESGAGWLVKTQKDRGRYYQNMTLDLLASKNCVGWHWFRYADNDPEDPTTDPSNRNSNKGIVNVHYQPYAELVDQMKQINQQAYRLIEFFDDAFYADAVNPNQN
jgi:hypothetical protein